MPRYAYIDNDLISLHDLPNIEVDETLHRVDSMTLTKQEWEVLNGNKIALKCYACDCEYTFIVNSKNKNPFFRHKHGREACFQAESLAHAQTKKVLYKRFKEAGYEVATEKTFAIKGKTVRSDVAVKDQIDLLAIEVQANDSIQLHTIATRVNAYHDINVPTAWVILLDSFFGEGNYTGVSEVKLIKHEDGTFSNEKVLLPYNKKAVFQVVGKEVPKNFLMLIDKYCYVIAVNRDGEFFVISRDPARNREDGLLIYRLPYSQVIEALLQTPLIKIDYEVKERNEMDKKPSEFQGSLFHLDLDELEGEKLLGYSIDFDQAESLEKEKLKTEASLNAVEEIKATLLHYGLETKWKDHKMQLLQVYNELIKDELTRIELIKKVQSEMEYKLQFIESSIIRKQQEEEERIREEAMKKRQEEILQKYLLKKEQERMEREKYIQAQKKLEEKEKKVEEEQKIQQQLLEEQKRLKNEKEESEKMIIIEKIIEASEGVRFKADLRKQLLQKSISELEKRLLVLNQMTLF